MVLNTGCTSKEVQSNKAPNVIAGEDIHVSVGEKFNFAGSASDPDGNIVSYEWDADGDGKYDTFCKNCGRDAYTFEKPGTYTAKLKVIDDDGAVGTDELTIYVE
ncbi:MAG: PKD domain-containing protein [Candidatus Undinarchaeales archaeon]|jgi:PKD repeat protein|nr:PKD domain-containing protein [Candidatus Undinarchaeales archaeon]